MAATIGCLYVDPYRLFPVTASVLVDVFDGMNGVSNEHSDHLEMLNGFGKSLPSQTSPCENTIKGNSPNNNCPGTNILKLLKIEKLNCNELKYILFANQLLILCFRSADECKWSTLHNTSLRKGPTLLEWKCLQQKIIM